MTARNSRASVDVYVRRFSRQPGENFGRARDQHVIRITAGEAAMLEPRYARWRGKAKKALLLLIPPSALYAFLGAWRMRPRPEVLGIDSRTHVNLGGLKGYEHRRNASYTPLADQLMQSMQQPGAAGKDPLEIAYRQMERELRAEF